MVERGRDDVRRAIAEGIALLDDLTERTAQLLYSVFSAVPPLDGLKPHHVGILVPPCNHDRLLTAIREQGLRITGMFPSAVVAAELAQRYRSQVSIDVYFCEVAADPGPALEIFHVTAGLSDAQTHAACAGVLHVALAPAPGSDIPALRKRMAADGFCCVGGGTNSKDVLSTAEGVTVLYFRTPQCATIKLELQLAGIHPILASYPAPGVSPPVAPTQPAAVDERDLLSRRCSPGIAP